MFLLYNYIVMYMNILEEINGFFEHDMNIKQSFVDMAPAETYLYNRDYVITYFDHLYKTLEYLRSEFKEAAYNHYHDQTIAYIDALFEQIMADLLTAGYDGDKLRKFYHDRITYMRPNFNAIVSQNLSGYYLFRNPAYTIKQAKSLNELLHAMHANIVNNDALYDLAEEIASAKGTNNYELHMYGKDSQLARIIYDTALESGLMLADETLILSVNENKVLVMARGLGHATSFEFDMTDQGDIRVAYFIPKICDTRMVNALKGINQVSETAPVFSGATGRFYTTPLELHNDFSELLYGIPTDDDLMKDPFKRERI